FGEPVDIETGVMRLEEILEEKDIDSYLLEAADLCAGMGGVFLKIDVDRELSSMPILTSKSPADTIAHFKYGFLQEVEFLKEVSRDAYLVEKRSMSGENLNIEYSIKHITSTGYLKDYTLNYEERQQIEVPEDVTVQGAGCLGVQYVPNLLPNRNFVDSSQGMSDYEGLTDLMDALDETWTSWMNDIELGKTRILIDESVTNNGKFDKNDRAFMTIDLDEWRITEGRADPITDIQFDIRYEEHAKTAKDLVTNIISRAGYAPQTFGMNTEGMAESGTSRKIKERKSETTRKKKVRYWKHNLTDFFEQVQKIDISAGLNGSYNVERPDISFPSFVQSSIEDISNTVLRLDQAQAASAETKIRMVHPDWSDEQVEEEASKLASPMLPDEILNG